MKRLITQKKENGTVCRKEKNKIWIALDIECNDKSTQKKDCSGGCISCSKKTIVRKSCIDIADSSIFNLGQTVTISHFIPNPGLMGFVVFGIPVVLALTTMALWFYFDPKSADSSMAILATCFAFASGLLALKMLDLLFRRKYPPTLLYAENHSAQDRQ